MGVYLRNHKSVVLLRLFVIVLCLSAYQVSVGQNSITKCTTSLNEQKLLVTTCSTQYSVDVVQQVFKGTPFFTYPDWRAGSILLKGQQRELAGEIAYDMVDNNVYYRFDSTHSEIVKPNVFIIDKVKFISQSTRFIGKPYISYYQVLYDGITKLLKRTTRKITLREDRREGYNGYYQDTDTYFIKRQTGGLISIKLTNKSVEKVLGGELKRSGQPVPTGKFPIEAIVNVLKIAEE